MEDHPQGEALGRFSEYKTWVCLVYSVIMSNFNLIPVFIA